MFIVVAIIFTIIGYSLGVGYCTRKLEKELEELQRELAETERELAEMETTQQ